MSFGFIRRNKTKANKVDETSMVDESHRTTDTEDSSTTSSLRRRPIKSVRFAEETTLNHSSPVVPEECFRDSRLWYQPYELDEIRQKCHARVHSKERQFDNCSLATATERFVRGGYQKCDDEKKNTPRVRLQYQLAKADRDELRGLEHFAIVKPCMSEGCHRPWWADQHSKRVLRAYQRGRNVAAVAYKTSQPCAYLARELARQDALQVKQ